MVGDMTNVCCSAVMGELERVVDVEVEWEGEE